MLKQIEKKNHVSYTFFRTCVPEIDLCLGIPLCQSKIDLKICKQRPFDDSIVPFDDHSYCQINKTIFKGQQISNDIVGDGV